MKIKHDLKGIKINKSSNQDGLHIKNKKKTRRPTLLILKNYKEQQMVLCVLNMMAWLGKLVKTQLNNDKLTTTTTTQIKMFKQTYVNQAAPLLLK